jgi:transposase InsO family protein
MTPVRIAKPLDTDKRIGVHIHAGAANRSGRASGLQKRRTSPSRVCPTRRRPDFPTLKPERVNRRRCSTGDEARPDLSDYIERFYNPRHQHSTPGDVSPVGFERRFASETNRS